MKYVLVMFMIILKIAIAGTESKSFESIQRQFTYSNLLKITNNSTRVLGKGGFGKVYHGYIDDTEVAVKMLSPSSVQGYQQFEAEVSKSNLEFLSSYAFSY